MSILPPNKNEEDALAAVLEAQDGEAWEDKLPRELHADARAWENLSTELRDSLRMGPGGLHDHQRAKILDAIDQVESPNHQISVKPGKSTRFAHLLWKSAAAIAFSAIVWQIFSIPGTQSPPPELTIQSKESHAHSMLDAETQSFQVRILPGNLAGSRFTSRTAKSPLERHPQFTGDWSAIGSGGGFQPSFMANVAEVVPHNLPGADLPLSLLFSNFQPGSASRKWTSDLPNLFRYAFPPPDKGEVLALHVDSGPCPWNEQNRLVMIGLNSKDSQRNASDAHDPVARDVRLVMEFNPELVSAYRQVGQGIGYSRTNQDSAILKGADLKSGQSMVVIYEIVPTNNASLKSSASSKDILLARVLFREGNKSARIERHVSLQINQSNTPESTDFSFASAVAACGLLLEEAPGMSSFQLTDAHQLAKSSLGKSPDPRRLEFVQLLGAKLSKR